MRKRVVCFMVRGQGVEIRAGAYGRGFSASVRDRETQEIRLGGIWLSYRGHKIGRTGGRGSRGYGARAASPPKFPWVTGGGMIESTSIARALFGGVVVGGEWRSPGGRVKLDRPGRSWSATARRRATESRCRINVER